MYIRGEESDFISIGDGELLRAASPDKEMRLAARPGASARKLPEMLNMP